MGPTTTPSPSTVAKHAPREFQQLGLHFKKGTQNEPRFRKVRSNRVSIVGQAGVEGHKGGVSVLVGTSGCAQYGIHVGGGGGGRGSKEWVM